MRSQIQQLMEEQKKAFAQEQPLKIQEPGIFKKIPVLPSSVSQNLPPLPPGIDQFFLPAQDRPASQGEIVYHPAYAALGKVFFIESRMRIHQEEYVSHLVELQEGAVGVLWDESFPFSVRLENLKKEPDSNSQFRGIPATLISQLQSAGRSYEDFLARSYKVSLWKSGLFKTETL